jgi:uncharacterized integral membrane protein (TIGR00698 family)
VKWLGVAFATCIAVAALLAEAVTPLAPVAMALFATLAIANTAGTPSAFKPGLDWAAKKLLFLAIVLLGFRIRFADLRAVGDHWLILLVALAIPLILAWTLRGKVGKAGLLVGFGTAICGVSAIAAARPGVGADDDEFAAAVGTVTILGAIGLLAYPLIGWAFDLPVEVYGIWSGLTLHAVPQAVGAGFALGAVSGGLATTFKLARVAALPIVLLASNKKGKIPREVIGFVAAVVVGNIGLFPAGIIFFLGSFAKIPLLIAISAIGMQTRFASLKMGYTMAFGAIIWLITSATVLWMAS